MVDPSSIREFREIDRRSIELIAGQVIEQGNVFPFYSTKAALEYWFSPNARQFVYEMDGEVVGTYVIKPNLPDKCAHVANAGYMVDNRYRGKRIGYQMGVHSIEKAKQLGYASLQFNIVVATNVSAIRLWEKLGFNTVGVIPDGFRADDNQFVDLLIMHCPLS